MFGGEGIVQQRGFRSPTFKEFPGKAVAALFALSVWERIGEGLVRDYKSFPQSPPQKRGEEKGARQTKRAEQVRPKKGNRAPALLTGDRDRRFLKFFDLLYGINPNRLGCRGIQKIFFVPGRFFGCCLLLDHLAAAFEDSALLDYQRRRLNVAIHFRRATEFNSLPPNDIAIYDALNIGHCNFDVGVDLPTSANDQHAGVGSDAP